ncbi:MAG: CDP-alcohol phosphatidyltransferase family protein, partial [Bacteroidia bacterium]|nr:CDP-alcohol phosphatidyltransferase family protein [Bacteroidia bacterium]
MKRSIPNAITCGNLLCGCLAIVKAFNGDLVWAAYLVGIAAVLDFFDGFAARMLKVSSPIGKDLDSLADMVTFGVVPGVVMFRLLSYALQSERIFES